MMKRQNIRTLFLIIGTFTYLLCGASFFDYAESKHEKMQRTALNKIENMIIRKYNISAIDFRVLTTVIIKNVPHKAGVQWKFSGAFYFATTVLTTIGYGHSTPATYLGKSFCMLYALLGIPLGLVMFQSIGERLNTFVAFSLRFCKRCLRFKKAEMVVDTNSIPLSDKCLIISVSIISTLVMTIGAAVFSHWENWSYFDAFYYCFITLTTIGFGDYVALQKNSALQDKPEYVIFSLVFILFGLSVVSAAINLLVLRFLTMNTEDERRDEAEAALTAASGVRLEGDVITANGSIISGIIPMENYLHNTSAYPAFTPSRYHVYNYPPSANLEHYSKKKFARPHEQDDLFSDPEYVDTTSHYEHHPDTNFNVEADSELMQETETSSNQPIKPYFPKQVLISDSNSERTFNTLGSNLARLKAHHSTAEQSELSVSSSLTGSSKRRTSKVFCKTSNHLLGKQRKNYKHMISEEESEAESGGGSDRASVCSCTCYGNNQSSRSSEFWRGGKSKKSKKVANLEMQRAGQAVILNNRKLPSAKRPKGAQRSGVKYKSMKSTTTGRNRANPEEEFNLNQLNKLNQLNQLETAETILRSHYYPPPLTGEPPIFPLNLFYLPPNSLPLDQQQFIAANEALLKQQRPSLAMQHQLSPELLAANEHLRNQLIQKELICNLSASGGGGGGGGGQFAVSQLSSSDHVLNQLNALNMKNLSYLMENEKGTMSASQLNAYSTQRDEQAELAKETKLTNRSKLKSREKSKERRNQGTRLTGKSDQQGSSEYLLRHSNEGIVDQGQSQFVDSKPGDQADTDGDFLTVDQAGIKLDTQRASI